MGGGGFEDGATCSDPAYTGWGDEPEVQSCFPPATSGPSASDQAYGDSGWGSWFEDAGTTSSAKDVWDLGSESAKALQGGAEAENATGGLGILGDLFGRASSAISVGSEAADAQQAFHEGDNGMGVAHSFVAALDAGGAAGNVPMGIAGAAGGMMVNGEEAVRQSGTLGKDPMSGQNLGPMDVAARFNVGLEDRIDQTCGPVLGTLVKAVVQPELEAPAMGVAAVADVGAGAASAIQSGWNMLRRWGGW